MPSDYDVLIIGSSLAGASLAIRLSRVGLRVCLVDKAVFPRSKACGEGLSARGLLELTALGIAENFQHLPHHSFSGYSLWRNEKESVLSFSGEDLESGHACCGAGIERRVLDHLVLCKALESGSVTYFEGVAVDDVTPESCGYSVRIHRELIKARYLVLADGAKSHLARRLGFVSKGQESLRYGLTFRLHGDFFRPLENVHILLQDSYQVCLTQVAADRLNASVLFTKAAAPVVRSPTFVMHLLEHIYEVIGFKGQLAGGKMAAGHLGQSRVAASHPGILLVGDTAEQLDPIGGMGMTHALISARLAAETLVEALGPGSDENALWRSYEHERNEVAKPLRGFTRLAYWALVRFPELPFGKLSAVRTLANRIEKSSLAQAVGQHVHGATQPPSLLSLLSKTIINAAARRH